MKINWFPGHMTKALRMMEDELKKVDVILYVLDGRAPYSSLNPKFNEIFKDKPIIYIINKIDISDPAKIDLFIKKYIKDDLYLLINSTKSGELKNIEKIISNISNNKIERYKRRNVNPVLRGMVVGVPNSGKSTLINNLCNDYKTITGNKPGVTRGKQWLKVNDGFEICDTPGTLWPSFEQESVAKNLAYIGSIKDEVLDISELALEFIKDIIIKYPRALFERYKIEIKNCQPIEILENIAICRGFKIKGGEIDYFRTAITIIDDFRKGRLGKITLDNI